MTALSTLAPSLKRELAVPGTFDDVFPDTGDEDLIASLADGFAESQLYGFFPDFTLAEGAGDYETSADLSAAGAALVVIFTSIRFVRAQMRAINSSERYKAGATEYEITRSANLLRDELKYLQERIKALVTTSARPVTSVAVIDNYFARGGSISAGGLYPYEYRG